MIAMEVFFQNNIYYKGGIVFSILAKIINNSSINLSIIPNSNREDEIFVYIYRDFNRL